MIKVSTIKYKCKLKKRVYLHEKGILMVSVPKTFYHYCVTLKNNCTWYKYFGLNI